MSTAPSPAPESPALSHSDFPALSAATEQPAPSDTPQADEPSLADAESQDGAAQEKAARKAAKKAAAAERAAERAQKAAQRAAEKAAEKERVAKEKALEKERQAALKAEKEKEAKEKAEREKVEKEKAAKERAERLAKEKEAAEKAERERAAEAQKAAAAAKAAKQTAITKASKVATPSSTSSPTTQADKGARKAHVSKQSTPTPPSEPGQQAPILARMPKKNKPLTKIKIPREDHITDAASVPSAATSDAPQYPEGRGPDSSSNNSRAHSVDRSPAIQPVGIKEMLSELHVQFPWLGLSKHPFFDMSRINPASKVPLEYGPLVHALSALSVGGGSFANNMPSGSIDNAVSSFQQLLETLTQTISDLLRLLPRTTWDDSSSFDGVLRDMLKGDDFLDDGGDDENGQGKEDEVAALTLALERRARWMEVQLSKLEELHRDINTAAVRAVLSFNDNGWDPHGSLPRLGNTLNRFDQIGFVSENGDLRLMTADELEEKLAVAKEAAQFVEAELREVMQNLQELGPTDEQSPV